MHRGRNFIHMFVFKHMPWNRTPTSRTEGSAPANTGQKCMKQYSRSLFIETVDLPQNPEQTVCLTCRRGSGAPTNPGKSALLFLVCSVSSDGYLRRKSVFACVCILACLCVCVCAGVCVRVCRWLGLLPPASRSMRARAGQALPLSKAWRHKQGFPF